MIDISDRGHVTSRARSVVTEVEVVNIQGAVLSRERVAISVVSDLVHDNKKL